MRKTLLSLIFVFTLAFITPATSHAGFFDIFKIFGNQSAQLNQATSVPAPQVTNQVLQRGDRSEHILAVQQALTKLGLYNGALSGLIGSRTEKAISDFQSRNNLPATGVLDTRTARLILSQSQGGQQLPPPPPPPQLTDADQRPGPQEPLPPRECNRTTQPWIEVVSPNGGEVYQAGQRIEVKWRNCNMQSPLVYISLMKQNPRVPYVHGNEGNIIDPWWGMNRDGAMLPVNDPNLSTSGLPTNSGSAIVVLPSDSNVTSGRNYFITISGLDEPTVGGGYHARDWSDDTFTIGGPVGAGCVNVTPVDDYPRLLNPGQADVAVSKIKIQNNCSYRVSVNSVQYAMASSRNQGVINSVDVWRVDGAGNLTSLSSPTINFSRAQSNNDSEATFSLADPGFVIASGQDLVLQMQGKVQSYPYYDDIRSTFTIGLKRLRYTRVTDGFVEQIYPWVWNERTVINAN